MVQTISIELVFGPKNPRPSTAQNYFAHNGSPDEYGFPEKARGLRGVFGAKASWKVKNLSGAFKWGGDRQGGIDWRARLAQLAA